jgi:type IV pilus assembly protein PilY1
MLAQPSLFNKRVNFSTYQLYRGPRSGCDAGNLGIARQYELDYLTGEAVENFDENNDITGSTPTNTRGFVSELGQKLERTDRYRVLGEEGKGGIPSGTVMVIKDGNVIEVRSSGETVETKKGRDVLTTYPVYWMQW